MSDATTFASMVLAASLAFLVAVMSSRLSALLRVPAPAVFLVGAAVASNLFPSLARIPTETVVRIVTVALVVVLFDGGMHIGWRRFRVAAGPVVWLGVAGTLVTALGITAAARLLFGLPWTESLLLGTALSPTDPAVVFSVLGGKEVGGRAGVLLEGESGANDPVGIALMVALLGAHEAGGGAAFGHGLLEFALQMLVGAAIGVAGGLALRAFMHVKLPNVGLYSMRALASALAVYGVATIAHGSGFLAVLITGILVGDEPVPFRDEIRSIHSSITSLAEIVAFVALGLTVDVLDVFRGRAWLIGLVLAVLLAFVIRPVLGGLVLWPVRLGRGERLFVLWAGLKGAVPILLGLFIVVADVPHASEMYAVIFVVVLFSVVVQGGLVPAVARRQNVPMSDGSVSEDISAADDGPVSDGGPVSGRRLGFRRLSLRRGRRTPGR
jgi:cell volume regulation protein A